MIDQTLVDVAQAPVDNRSEESRIFSKGSWARYLVSLTAIKVLVAAVLVAIGLYAQDQSFEARLEMMQDVLIVGFTAAVTVTLVLVRLRFALPVLAACVAIAAAFGAFTLN